jgi:hypothetical protein
MMANWRPITDNPPKTGADMVAKPFLAWCPDETAPDGGDIRVIWWEPKLNKGCWYSDREVVEKPTHWLPMPEAPKCGSVAIEEAQRGA